MKLVQLLAKELKEWPEDCDEIWQSAMDREIYFEGGDHGYFELSNAASDRSYEGAHVTKSQWQAEREKMNKPKWIRHRGGKCPVPCGTKVETRHRDGYICTPHFYTQNASSDVGMNLVWSHKGDKMDIMAYRVIEETKDQEIEEVKVADVKLEMLQGDSWATIGSVSSDFGASVFDGGQPAKGEEVKKTNFGTITYKLEIDATEATKEIDSLVAKWGQIESPLKWRDEIIELEAYEEEFRREREKLIRKLESEGFKLIDHVAPVYGEQIIGMSDWRNWQAGDVIEIVANEASHKFENGEEVIVVSLDLNDIDLSVRAEYKDGRDYWWLSGKDAKFMRRP